MGPGERPSDEHWIKFRRSDRLWKLHRRGSTDDGLAIEKLAAQYFQIDRILRHDALRVPLDRLDRSDREFDLTDRSIDLGIALEALLLHAGPDPGELGFRLGLRGAWLGGKNAVERAEIQKTIREAYRLRSQAVHLGRIEHNARNLEINRRGTELCRRLIQMTIDAGGKIDWDMLVLGG